MTVQGDGAGKDQTLLALLLFRAALFSPPSLSSPPVAFNLRVALGLLRHFAVMANDVRFFAPPYWKIDQCAERAARDPPCPWAERRLGPALSFLARQGERFAPALVVLGELHWRGGWND